MKEKRKKLIIGVLLLMILSMTSVGMYYWYNNVHYVSTEDAKIWTDFVKVAPQISGKLLELNMEEGQRVEKDQILAIQEMLTVSDSNIELSVVRAPVNGIILKKQGNVGEIASPGQTLAVLGDPNKFYISANIEETKLKKLKVGQVVDITIDEYKNKKFKGKIASIGQASSSAFALIPTSSGGNYTKVVQKVPVKISLDSYKEKILPGINAVVKIHIK